MFAYTSPMNIEFMSGPIALDTEPVTGAPYSAEAVTDVVQHLADGNRIVRQNKAQISRDGQGRTRREQGFAMFGPLVNGPRGNEMRNVQISDPTTGSMVMLDLQSRTAHRMPGAPRMMMREQDRHGGPNGNAGVNVQRSRQVRNSQLPCPPHEASGGVMVNRMEAISTMPGETAGRRIARHSVHGRRGCRRHPHDADDSRRDRSATSCRSRGVGALVFTGPEGAGDEPTIRPALRRDHLSAHQHHRSEPSPQLFEIPADFTVIDPGAQREMIFERKIVK